MAAFEKIHLKTDEWYSFSFGIRRERTWGIRREHGGTWGIWNKNISCDYAVIFRSLISFLIIDFECFSFLRKSQVKVLTNIHPAGYHTFVNINYRLHIFRYSNFQANERKRLGHYNLCLHLNSSNSLGSHTL